YAGKAATKDSRELRTSLSTGRGRADRNRAHESAAAATPGRWRGTGKERSGRPRSVMTQRVLFYVQHLLGIGHLRRAAALSRALVAAGAEVAFVSGGEPVPALDLGGARLIQLPPASAADAGFSKIVDEHGRPVDAAWQERRRD